MNMFNFILPQLFIQIERWKWNSEYRVYVSNLGKFKNEHKQLLPVKINNNGYCLVKTECGFKLAHRIVMLTWCPIPNAEELTVDHLNHNKRDNSVTNLEWVTRQENCRRAAADYVPNVCNEPVTEKYTLKAGQHKFIDYDDAVRWLVENKCVPQDVCVETLKRRIENAVKNKKMYCGRKWKEIK